MQYILEEACPRSEFILLKTKANEGLCLLWKYVFAQLIEFLPQKTFQRIVIKYQGDKYIKSFSCWNQLLIMMYGQLFGCESLRELVYITTAHSQKSYHLGFGKSLITRSNLAKANANRECKIFEEFAYKMISIAQKYL